MQAGVPDPEPVGTLGGSGLASWQPLVTMLVVYGVIVVALWFRGDRGDGDLTPIGALRRIGRGMTRTTGLPGWAGVAMGQYFMATAIAGQGFYDDVAWHIALGRDDELFTAPHTAILVGLVGILSAAVLGTVLATLDGHDGGWRVVGLTVPWSMVPLGALGLGAVSGFPADEVWHRAYGVDVTMWSPTHMLMILGASFSGLAVWLVVAEVGETWRSRRWRTAISVLAAWFAFSGLVAPLGEFSFGVPQFGHIFSPLIVSMAAGAGLVATRLVLGTGGAALATGIYVVTTLTPFLSGDLPVDTRDGATFVVSALAVELLAIIVGTEQRTRFALCSGVAIGTVGLAGEWVWNQGAPQPWRDSLLPEVVVWSVVGAVGAALVGIAFVTAFSQVGRRPGRGVALGAAVGLVMVAVPVVVHLPRGVGDVEVDMTLAVSDDGDEAIVEAVLQPADAADDARWFQVTAWQGGGLVLRDMVEIEPGRWRSEGPVPVTGLWKTLLRLHVGNDLMAVPIWFPADPEIDEPEIPAVDRSGPFEAESRYLMRETHAGAAWLSPVVHTYLVVVVAGWIAAFWIAVDRLGRRGAVTVEPLPTGDPSGGRVSPLGAKDSSG